jgi:hypothetical protein
MKQDLVLLGAFSFVVAGCGAIIGSGTINPGIWSSSIDGFPTQLLGFSGSAAPLIAHDGSAWDAHGIGAPSNVMTINGEYWLCYAGYPTSVMSSQSIGCASGPQLTALQPYSGNPIFTNSQPWWAGACIEGPMFWWDGPLTNPSTHIYMQFDAYFASCDGEGSGSIGQVVTTVANFPNGWSAMGANPLISKPDTMQWLYEPDVVRDPSSGIFYDFSNGGDAEGNPIIAYFTASSINGPWTYQGVALSTTQQWESGGELQDPQVWQDASGLWIMVFGADARGPLLGLAVSKDLINWTQLSDNPVLVMTTGNTYLPRIVLDAKGDYWMVSGPNNKAGTGIYLDRAVGR